MSSPGGHAVPFFCPYCGEEDLRPYGESAGGWWCADCRRAWTLRFVGTGTPDAAGGEPKSGDDAPG